MYIPNEAILVLKNIKETLNIIYEKGRDLKYPLYDFCSLLNTRITSKEITPRGFVLTILLICDEIESNCQIYSHDTHVLPESLMHTEQEKRLSVLYDILAFIPILILQFKDKIFVAQVHDQFDFFIKDFKKLSIK